MLNELCQELRAKFQEDQVGFSKNKQRFRVRQKRLQKLGTLTQQLHDFRPVNIDAPHKMRDEVTTKFVDQLSETKAEMNYFKIKVAKQSKTTTKTTSAL